MWLVGCLAPDFKTIADLRKDNGEAIRAVVYRALPSTEAIQSCCCCDRWQQIQGRQQSRQELQVVKVGKRMEQVDASIARYLAALDRADREEGDIADAKTNRIKEKIAGLRCQIRNFSKRWSVKLQPLPTNRTR